MTERAFEYVTPDRMDCHTAHDIHTHAAAHGWHTVGFRGLAGSDTPGRIDETLVLNTPDRTLEIWLFMHDVDGDGVASDTWWRARTAGTPAVEDLQLLRNLIRELGVINLTAVA